MSKMTTEMRNKIEKLITMFVEGQLSAGALIEGIVAAKSVNEKVSDLYDIRHGQNCETGPVEVNSDGTYSVRQARRGRAA